MSRKGKSGKRKKKTAKQQPNLTTKKTKSKRRISSRTKKIILIVWTVITVVSVIANLWIPFRPRVFVYSGPSLDPNNPAQALFTIRNQGNLAIYDIKISNSMRYLELPGVATVIGLGDYTNRFSDPKHVASVLKPGQEFTVPLALSGIKGNKFGNADIAIVVPFKLKLWPWKQETLHRFVSIQGKDGQWYWLPQPISK